MSSLPFGSVPDHFVQSAVEAIRDGVTVDYARTAMPIEEAISEAKKLSGAFDNVIVHNAQGGKVWSLR